MLSPIFLKNISSLFKAVLIPGVFAFGTAKSCVGISKGVPVGDVILTECSHPKY